MPFPHFKPGRRTNQDVFFAYYSRLLEWALQITSNDRSEAEDLVHDFYLRVTRITRSIDEIEQLEHYLFQVLRHLYYARLRRAGRDPLNELSIVDYDSVEQGLAAVDRRELLFVHDHLRKVCSHACERKNTVRSASVLILRFFLGYYPIELMKILQVGRSSVDMLLQVARNEARLSLERPDAIRCISASTRPPVSFSANGENTQQLFSELQDAIFSAREGECFKDTALESRYAVGNEVPSLTTLELSHLVSCKTCLDRANGILHLPLLAERSPEDGIDRDSPSGPGGASGSGILRMRKSSPKKGPPLRKLERRARDLFEHRPASLEIVVDGEVRTSHRVTAEISELRLKLAHKEEPSFIEVLSEQGFCLAYLEVDEPVSSDKLEQAETALFSDDRSLVLTLKFAAEGPIIHVLYRDPVVADAAVERSSARSAADDALAEEINSSVGLLPKPIVIRPQDGIRRWAERVIIKLKGSSRGFVFQGLSPLAPVSALVVISVAVCLWVWPRHSAPMTATALLQHAEASQAAPFSAAKTQIVYEKVRIRTAKSSFERRIYRDTSGRREQKTLPVDPQTTALETKLAGAGVSWNEPLSAASYQDWHDHIQVTADAVRETGQNLLTLTTTVSGANVTQESLTIRESDFHPVARSISFRDTGEVEIAEVDYQVLPWNAEGEAWFDPATQPLSDIGPAAPSLRLHVPDVLSDLQLDEAELSARLALNQLHADTGEQVEIMRFPSGIVVKGMVETEQRRRDLDDRLHTLPHVMATLSSLERMKRDQAQGADDITGFKVASMQSQATSLEAYYLAHGRSIASLSKLSQQLLNSAFAIDVESRAIDDLQHRFARRDGISVVASATLSDLLFTHKHKLLAALAEEEHLLDEAQIETALSKTNTPSNDSDLAPAALAARNLALTRELTLSNGGRGQSAELIASELVESIHELYRHAHAAQIVPRNFTSLDKRK